MKRKVKILSVVGARPNFIKIAAFVREVRKHRSIKHVLVHTGQHYDKHMSSQFFSALEIPKPTINLGVRENDHGAQTGEIMKRFEKVCYAQKPDLVVVVGDINSTVAAALVAVKLGIRVAHIEAGLRSFDRTMPEEINRMLTDQISDFLFVTEPSGVTNLRKEGIVAKKIFYVGNTMIDTLKANMAKIKKSTVLERYALCPMRYAVVTMHRPANVDNGNTLKKYVRMLNSVAKELPIVFPVHPRTKRQLGKLITKNRSLVTIDPLGYHDFLQLVRNARLVLTDSGGIQEEASVLGVPCITMRDNTERPITISKGTNILAGTEQKKIYACVKRVLRSKKVKPKIIPKWDGNAANRIVLIILSELKLKDR